MDSYGIYRQYGGKGSRIQLDAALNLIYEYSLDRAITKDDIEQAILLDLLEKGSWFPNAMNIEKVCRSLGMIKGRNGNDRGMITPTVAFEISDLDEPANSYNNSIGWIDFVDSVFGELGDEWCFLTQQILKGYTIEDSLKSRALSYRDWVAGKPRLVEMLYRNMEV